MQLISLNIWGGKIHDPLLEFINKHKDSTDIFSIQEALKYKKNIITNDYYANILGELKDSLSDFNFYFAPRCLNVDPKDVVDFPIEFGQVTFIKKSIKILEQNEIFVYKSFNLIKKRGINDIDLPSLILNSIIDINSKKILIVNFHGLVEYAPKHDIENRIRQSQFIIDHIEHLGLPTIIAGDFNLRLETKSLKMFEDFGMRNLVKESGTKTTRSTLYEEKWRKIDKYSDYILTSKNIYINDFKVMKDKISDHLPLMVNFEV